MCLNYKLSEFLSKLELDVCDNGGITADLTSNSWLLACFSKRHKPKYGTLRTKE